MNLRSFFSSSDPRIRWRRGLMMVISGLLLIVIAIVWRSLATGPSVPAGVYDVTAIYGQGGFAEPLDLQTITVQRRGLVLEGGSGGVVTGEHRIRHVNGPMVLLCDAQDGDRIDAQISKDHRQIRVRMGQCLVEGKRP